MSKLKRPKSFKTSRSIYREFREELFALIGQEQANVKSAYLLLHIESKLLDPDYSDSAEDRRSAAILKWLLTEERNCVSNQRLLLSEDSDIVFNDVSWGSLKGFCQRFIRGVIGDKPYFMGLSGSFSGGASTDIRRSPEAIAKKFCEGQDVTAECLPHALKFFENTCVDAERFRVVPGNVLFTVPKSTTIDRCAAKEPTINLYLQKATGDYIRRSLMKQGCNLNDQTVNQRLAYLGSLDGSLATIDLSAASDSLTTQLVTELLPFDWSSFLMDIRSPFTEVDGELHENEMISSMGNGFTFELESLIFLALSRAACYFSGSRGFVSVYGDDIVIPSQGVQYLEAFLSFCGFSFNREKSFWEGNFRESCGKHYYHGSDVSPFYVRTVPSNVRDWIKLLNQLRKWLEQDSLIDILDPMYYDLWRKYAELTVPKPLWGGWDYNRIDILVAPGVTPLAKLSHRIERKTLGRKLQLGGYLHWLNAKWDSPSQLLSDKVTGVYVATDTSSMLVEHNLVLRKHRPESWSRTVSRFPQEWGLHD